MTTHYKKKGSLYIRFFCIDVKNCDGSFITLTRNAVDIIDSDASLCPKCGGRCIESKFGVAT